MRAEPSDWERLLEPITSLRQLYYLFELCGLPDRFREGDGAAPGSIARMNGGAPERQARGALRSAVWARLERVYRSVHDGYPEDVRSYALEDGFQEFVVIWDHWQDSLKQIVCGIRPGDGGRPWSLDKPELWEEEESPES